METLCQENSSKNVRILSNPTVYDLQTVIAKGFMSYSYRLKYEINCDNSVVLVGKSGKTRMTLSLKYVYQYRCVSV